MSVTVDILLFLKAEDEFTEHEITNPVKFRRKVAAMRNHLKAVADAVDKLHKAGWAVERGVNDLSFYPNEDYSEDEAETILRELGIDPTLAWIREDEDEEDDEDFDKDAEDVAPANRASSIMGLKLTTRVS
jgi:hypothetical protein